MPLRGLKHSVPYSEQAQSVYGMIKFLLKNSAGSADNVSGISSFSDVRQALEDAGIAMLSAEVTMIPQTWVTLTDETAIKSIQKTLDMLDEDDDVQAVYHNWDE